MLMVGLVMGWLGDKEGLDERRGEVLGGGEEGVRGGGGVEGEKGEGEDGMVGDG